MEVGSTNNTKSGRKKKSSKSIDKTTSKPASSYGIDQNNAVKLKQ